MQRIVLLHQAATEQIIEDIIFRAKKMKPKLDLNIKCFPRRESNPGRSGESAES